ncbi:MAG: hypothetical protein RMN53_16740 [Anaerolineae bacterium]|nr:hypothetical protein [Anaerolineae bacterium]
MLLLLVATEHADLRNIGLQEAAQHGVAKGAGATGDEERFSSELNVRHLERDLDLFLFVFYLCSKPHHSVGPLLCQDGQKAALLKAMLRFWPSSSP